MFLKKFFFPIAVFLTGTLSAFAGEDASQTRFLYVRHGEVPGNDPNPAVYLYTGCGTDESLTETGQIQAGECAKAIALLQEQGVFGEISAIYSSDLKREVETASPIAKELGLEIEQNHNLREISWGSADGQLVKKMTDEWKPIEQQVKLQYPERKERWDHLPVFAGAETYNALLNRTVTEFQQIAKIHEGETVLIVGHGRVLKTLVAEVRDSEENIPYPDNCGIAEFTYSSNEGLQLVKVWNRQGS